MARAHPVTLYAAPEVNSVAAIHRGAPPPNPSSRPQRLRSSYLMAVGDVRFRLRPRGEGPGRLDHLLAGALEEEMAGVRQLDRRVVGKRLLEALEVSAREPGIPHAPEDQRPAVSDPAETSLDLRQVVRRRCDLTWI